MDTRKNAVKTISPIELQNFLQTEPDAALLDVRTPVEYAQVHLSRATNEPLDSMRPKKQETLQ